VIQLSRIVVQYSVLNFEEGTGTKDPADYLMSYMVNPQAVHRQLIVVTKYTLIP
jgi:hypothetical protein